MPRPRNPPTPKALPRSRKVGPVTPLTRERIVACALALVDREGLEALSMRRLGLVLGVDPMAVYYHLPSKEALLDAIVEAVMATIDLTVDQAGEPPEARVLGAARAYREALLAHGNALPIVLVRGPVTPAAMRPVEVLLRILREGGLAPAEALAGMNAIAAAVRGAVAMEGAGRIRCPEDAEAMARSLQPGEFPCLLEAIQAPGQDPEASFAFGIRALARGLLR